MPSGVPHFVGIETASRETWAFHPALALGLLQTEAYARALYELAMPIEETTSEFIDRNVLVRLRRKEALTRDEQPLRLRAVLHGPAPRYVVGDPDVMRKQYEESAFVTPSAHALHERRKRSAPDKQGRPLWELAVADRYAVMRRTSEVGDPNATSLSDKPREVGRSTRKFNALTASALAPEDTPAFLQQPTREIAK